MKGVVFMDKSKYSKEARYVVEDSRILNYANKAAKRVPEITDELKRMIFLFDNVFNYFSDNIGSVKSYISPMLNSIISKKVNQIDKDYFLFPTDSDNKTVYKTQHNILKDALTAKKCLEAEEDLYNISKEIYTDYPSYDDFEAEIYTWFDETYEMFIEIPNEKMMEDNGYSLEEYFKQSLKIEQNIDRKLKRTKIKKGFCTFLIIAMIYNLISGIIPFFMYYQDNMSIVEFLTGSFFTNFITILDIAILIIAIILRKHYKKAPEKIKNKVKKQTQECLDYYKESFKEKLLPPMNKIFKESYKDRKDELQRKYNELIENHKKLEKIYFEDKKALEQYSKEFLPTRAADNSKILECVVEYMSTGRAINYKDALFLAEQKLENDSREKQAEPEHKGIEEMQSELSEKLMKLKEEYNSRLNA